MGNIEEVVRIRKALESLIENPGDIPTGAPVHIDELENMKMNLKTLQKSKIGFTLNFLRKATSDESVKKSAKSLIKKWQNLEETKAKPSAESVPPPRLEVTAPPPSRNKAGQLVFSDQPDF